MNEKFGIKHMTVIPKSKDDKEIEMKVRFTQDFTIRPPESISNSTDAKMWFYEDPEMRLRDGIDVRKGDVDVLEINDS